MKSALETDLVLKPFMTIMLGLSHNYSKNFIHHWEQKELLKNKKLPFMQIYWFSCGILHYHLFNFFPHEALTAKRSELSIMCIRATRESPKKRMSYSVVESHKLKLKTDDN